jgi:proteic killer suppression protein
VVVGVAPSILDQGTLMIGSFRDEALKTFWERSDVQRLPTDWIERIAMILDLLDAASSPEDMAIPGLGFHGFAEGTKPRFGVMASKAWRVSFSWHQGRAHDVDLNEVR